MGRVSVQCLRQISTKRHATPVSGFHSSLLPGKTKKKLYFLSLFTFLLFLMRNLWIRTVALIVVDF